MFWTARRVLGTPSTSEDEQYGGYSVAQLEMLLNECNFLGLVERPGLLRTGLPWVLEPGKAPEARV